MKKTTAILLLSGLCIASLKAQNSLDCDFNLNEAIFYLEGDRDFKRDTLKSISLLKPCVEKGDSYAKILLSRIYSTQNNEEQHKKAFEILDELARKGNSLAAAELGVLYKYGIGCKINFNKARKWFEKAAQQGNDKAAYSLGYMYLKGLGNFQQSYSMAIQWFKKSSYSMAQYWLGICYYYGYGVEPNREKAQELLGNQNIETHELAFERSSNFNNSSNDILDNFLLAEHPKNHTALELSDTNMFGEWTGKLYKLDWSGVHIEQKHNAHLKIKYDSIAQVPVYTLTLGSKVFEEQKWKLFNEVLYLENLDVNLPHTSFQDQIPSSLDYQLLSAQLHLQQLEQYAYLTADVKSYINDWKESGAPLRWVFRKREQFSNTQEEISNDVLDGLAKQKQNFIKLYPNPFARDLVISYTLKSAAMVEVTLTNMQGNYSTVVAKAKLQKAGVHTFFFDGLALATGTYIVSVNVGNSRKTRIIIKQ